MSAVEDYRVDEIHEFSIGDCVSVNLEHPLAHRHVQGILGIPFGYIIESRVLQFGVIRTTELHQCLVEWHSGGYVDRAWVDCAQLVPVEHAVEKIRSVLSILAEHPRSGGVTEL